MANYEVQFSMESFRQIEPMDADNALQGALEYVQGYLEDPAHDRSLSDVTSVLIATRRILDNAHDHTQR